MDLHGGLHGAYLQRDLIAEVGRYPVRAAVRTGSLVRLWHRVLVDAKQATEVRTRAAAALLLHGPRSAIAGPTAAWLHGCTAIETADVHVIVPYGHHSRTRTGLVVHNGSFSANEVIEICGLRVLEIGRVATDLLCTARPRDAIAVADQMLAAQPPERREGFRARVGQLLTQRQDPRGTRRGARLLDLATGRAESPPESWLRLEVVELGFPVPETNWSLLSPAGMEVYRLDLAWPEHRIALEYNGYAVHVGREVEDERRAKDLRRRGWIVVIATSDDLADSRVVEQKLRAAFTQRGFRWPVC
jgi:hypothetical protein